MVTANRAAELREEFEVDENDLITEPGKFEGEHISIPYFWDCVLNGDCESAFNGDQTFYFLTIGPNDLEMFLDLKDIYGLCLYENTDGTVNSIWFDSRAEFNDAKDNLDEL